MSMAITASYEPESGTWSYLVADRKNRVAAIIDPVWVFDPVSGLADAGFVDGMLQTAESNGLRIEWVLETHAHADHLTAASYIREKTGAKVVIGHNICSVQEAFVRAFNLDDVATDGSQFDRLVAEGDILELGALKIRVMETPGHTNDSVSYLVENAAFIGDTLFAPTYGTARCDFPGGDAGRLFDSIQRIYGLPDDTRLFLCHDYPQEGEQPVSEVALAESRKNNVHLNSATGREAFVEMRIERDRHLDPPRLIMASVQVNIRAGAAPAPEGNGVSYLRLPFNRKLAQIVRENQSGQR
jgi:glyoxylase-like metal-dependent hydrolase (beta-lactamase superfamily II)